jgi:hypothetical protein
MDGYTGAHCTHDGTSEGNVGSVVRLTSVASESDDLEGVENLDRWATAGLRGIKPWTELALRAKVKAKVVKMASMISAKVVGFYI